MSRSSRSGYSLRRAHHAARSRLSPLWSTWNRRFRAVSTGAVPRVCRPGGRRGRSRRARLEPGCPLSGRWAALLGRARAVRWGGRAARRCGGPAGTVSGFRVRRLVRPRRPARRRNSPAPRDLPHRRSPCTRAASPNRMTPRRAPPKAPPAGCRSATGPADTASTPQPSLPGSAASAPRLPRCTSPSASRPTHPRRSSCGSVP